MILRAFPFFVCLKLVVGSLLLGGAWLAFSLSVHLPSDRPGEERHNLWFPGRIVNVHARLPLT